MHQKVRFANGFNADSTVQISAQKIFFFFDLRKCAFLRPSRLVQRDGRVVTNVEAGCDGRESCVRRTLACTDGEVVWSWRPDAGAKSAMLTKLAGDGSKRARFPGRARYKP